jgi:hypothetical protein
MTAGAPSESTGGPPPIGGLAEEAAQLLDAVAARLALVRLTMGDGEPADAGQADARQADKPPTDAQAADAPTGTDGQHVGASGRSGPAATDHPEPATRHAQCVGWCPVCRSADLLRGERPEVAGKLLDSAMVVVSALRSLLPAVPSTAHPSTDHSSGDHSSADQSAKDRSPDDTSASGPAESRPAATRPTTSRPARSGPAAPTGRSGGTLPPPGIERIDIR